MNQSKTFSLSIILILFCQVIFIQPGLAKIRENKDFEQAMIKFRVFYKNALQENGIVGSSFMFIHDNKVLAKEFYGWANIEQKRKVDEDTIYQWASITKTFTGIAIMQLRDRGLLRLDDPIIEYIPELKQVYNPFGDMGEITIRHLMSHCAGFRRPTWPWKSKPWHPHEPLHWEQVVAMFPYTEILFKPGSKWSYSNPGIIFLGRVIELLTTDDWEVYIDKNIFKPLKMYRSYFDTTPYHLMKYKCQSYFLKDGKLTPADPDVNMGITVSNGGLKSCFSDMVRYLNFLMGNSSKQDDYDQVLERASLEEMFKPQIEIKDYDQEFRGKNRKDFMGLTFFVEDNYGMHFIAHSGGNNAFVTHFYINQDSNAAYIIGFNTLASGEQQNTRVLDREIKEYLFENIFPLFNLQK
jgi:CubicO group peptidase (beta-lactamase class C family)